MNINGQKSIQYAEIKNKKEGLIVGFTAGNFDLIHYGYTVTFEEAKRHCDFLIVGLQNDPTLDRATKNKPVQSIVERQIQLAAVKYVDEIIIYNTEQDLIDLLLTLPIDVRVLGEEYKNKDFTGKDIAKQRGSKIIYNGRDHSFSSTSLRKRVASAENN